MKINDIFGPMLRLALIGSGKRRLPKIEGTRTARGRLSKLFGPLALDTDRAARTFGFGRLGQTDWVQLALPIRVRAGGRLCAK